MENDKLITVIVPVFNMECYLDECVQSILHQTYVNFEVILIDDCSTDRSGAMCDEYAAKDRRIRVLHKKQNEGLSCARNTGVQLAEGSYICFVDSDDFLFPDYLKVLYENAVLYNADVSWCGFVKFTDSLPSDKKQDDSPKLLTKQKLYEDLVYRKRLEIVVAWNKLIRRELALKLAFPPGRWHEDEFYVNGLLEKAERVVETDTCLYGYRQRKDSIMGSNHKRDLRHLDLIDAAEERVRFFGGIDRKLYERCLTAYRGTIIGQYRNFPTGSTAVRLKCRFLMSFLKYPTTNIRGIKGWILFTVNSGKFYEKYWR